MDKYDHFIIRAYQARGVVINEVSTLEALLNGVLSKYFCRDESHQKEMVELIFTNDRLNFRNKYHMLLDLLRKKCTQEEYDENFKGFQKKFDDISSVRNRFAHEMILPYAVDVDPVVFDKYFICFISFKGSTKIHGYTKEDIDTIVQSTSTLTDELMGKAYKKLFSAG